MPVHQPSPDLAALAAIGVDDTAARVYQVVVREPAVGRERLAAQLDLSFSDTDQAIATLHTLGLVEQTDRAAEGAVSAVDPRIGLGGLVRTGHSRLDRVAELAELFGVDFREAQLRSDPGQLVEVIDGARAIAARMGDLLAAAREEILNLYAPPLVNVDSLTGTDEAGKLDSGVKIRVIYAAESLRDERFLAAVLDDVAAGEEARVLRAVPMKLLVVDRTWAILPLTASESGTRGSAVLVHRSRLTDALVSLFEALWEQASPVSTTDGELDSEPRGTATAPDLQLLRLLAAGLKDETIARHLGISERTLRRRVTTLIDRLGAASRFQAGIQAARRGWL